MNWRRWNRWVFQEPFEIDPHPDDIDEITEDEKWRFQSWIREMFDNHRCEVIIIINLSN
jgi:pheromone shutdown protein TraB